ncbi:DUF3499 domain-containing protein [Agilicoccus flavus]|uniref:DUF3499 domain-containing protein n=1 Tax=Agilicoccus flavus TaxID=2775968 RepID=UPI001CF713B9
MRRCSRTACGRRAVATLTYVYADQTAVLGPLATFAEPHTYDLCAEHADRLTAPRGWEVVRLVTHYDDAPDPEDDLLAVADVLRDRNVREQASRRAGDPGPGGARGVGNASGAPTPGLGDPTRGHLRVLRDVQTGSGDR